MTSGNGNGHTVPGLWRWFAVTLFSVLLAVVGIAWQNQRQAFSSVAQELRDKVSKHEAALAALRERITGLEWAVKHREREEAP